MTGLHRGHPLQESSTKRAREWTINMKSHWCSNRLNILHLLQRPHLLSSWVISLHHLHHISMPRTWTAINKLVIIGIMTYFAEEMFFKITIILRISVVRRIITIPWPILVIWVITKHLHLNLTTITYTLTVLMKDELLAKTQWYLWTQMWLLLASNIWTRGRLCNNKIWIDLSKSW